MACFFGNNYWTSSRDCNFYWWCGNWRHCRLWMMAVDIAVVSKKDDRDEPPESNSSTDKRRQSEFVAGSRSATRIVFDYYFEQHDAADKATDMSKPGCASAFGATNERINHLTEKPQSNQNPGIDTRAPVPGNPGVHFDTRIQNQIGSQNTRYSTTGTDTTHCRERIGEDMGQVSKNATGQIKEQIIGRAHAVFDIVAKDIEKPQIANDVTEACMHKHGAKNCAKLIRTKMRDKASRYQSKIIKRQLAINTASLTEKNELSDKGNNIETNQ